MARGGDASWFEQVFGFQEVVGKYDDAQKKLQECCNGTGADMCISRWRVGEWRHASVGELREEASRLLYDPDVRGRISVKQVVRDVRDLHKDAHNRGAMFQAASQFNCLEFSRPFQTPEHGIDMYQHDHTQGPACAVSCGAAAAFRNYIVPVESGQGGTAAGQRNFRQLNGIREMQAKLDADDLFQVKNGYTDAGREALKQLGHRLKEKTDDEIDALRDSIRVGVHYNTQVTLPNAPADHLVGQIFCSACSVGYSQVTEPGPWEPLATLVLDAAYEATLWAAVLQHDRYKRMDHSGLNARGPPRVFLTKLGAGVFGNPDRWAIASMRRMLEIAADHGIALEATIVHFGSIDSRYQGIGDQLPAFLNSENTRKITYAGNVSAARGVECIASFPGKYGDLWDDLIHARAPDNPQDLSVACVFLTDAESGLGKHAENTDSIDYSGTQAPCYCRDIYGQRSYKQMGYLRIFCGDQADPRYHAQLQAAKEDARATKAIFLQQPSVNAPEAQEEVRLAKQRWEAAKGTTKTKTIKQAKDAWDTARKMAGDLVKETNDKWEKEREKGERRAAQRYEECNKTASWGCEWFARWKKNIDNAVERDQKLIVYYFKNSKRIPLDAHDNRSYSKLEFMNYFEGGGGASTTESGNKVQWKTEWEQARRDGRVLPKGSKSAWDRLSAPENNPWDGIGLGGSQKVEVAYLDWKIAEGDTRYEYEERDVGEFGVRTLPPVPAAGPSAPRPSVGDKHVDAAGAAVQKSPGKTRKAPSGPLSVGMKVVVQGLKQYKTFNGCKGVIQKIHDGKDGKEGRAIVDFGAEIFGRQQLRQRNLRPAAEIAKGPAAEDVLSSDDEVPAGSWVEAVGLIKYTGLNNCRGVVQKTQPNGRVVIDFGEHGRNSLRRRNLRAVKGEKKPVEKADVVAEKEEFPRGARVKVCGLAQQWAGLNGCRGSVGKMNEFGRVEVHFVDDKLGALHDTGPPRRVDGFDNTLKTREQFVRHYGRSLGAEEWENAPAQWKKALRRANVQLVKSKTKGKKGDPASPERTVEASPISKADAMSPMSSGLSPMTSGASPLPPKGAGSVLGPTKSGVESTGLFVPHTTSVLQLKQYEFPQKQNTTG